MHGWLLKTAWHELYVNRRVHAMQYIHVPCNILKYNHSWRINVNSFVRFWSLIFRSLILRRMRLDIFAIHTNVCSGLFYSCLFYIVQIQMSDGRLVNHGSCTCPRGIWRRDLIVYGWLWMRLCQPHRYDMPVEGELHTVVQQFLLCHSGSFVCVSVSFNLILYISNSASQVRCCYRHTMMKTVNKTAVQLMLNMWKLKGQKPDCGSWKLKTVKVICERSCCLFSNFWPSVNYSFWKIRWLLECFDYCSSLFEILARIRINYQLGRQFYNGLVVVCEDRRPLYVAVVFFLAYGRVYEAKRQ